MAENKWVSLGLFHWILLFSENKFLPWPMQATLLSIICKLLWYALQDAARRSRLSSSKGRSAAPYSFRHEKKWREAFNAGTATTPPGDPLRPAVCWTLLRHSVGLTTHGCQHCGSLMPCWQNWSGSRSPTVMPWLSCFRPASSRSRRQLRRVEVPTLPKTTCHKGAALGRLGFCRLGYWHWKDVSSMVGWQRCHGFLKYLGVKDGSSEARSIKNMDRHASNLQET